MDDRAEKIQGLNNLNKLHGCANPAFYATMHHSRAFRRRNLLRTFTENFTCRCGKPVDRFGQHAFVCENPYIKAAVTNTTHKHLSRNLKRTMDTQMRNIEMKALRSEPALDVYFERVEAQRQGSQDQIEIRRRADIAFKCKENKTPAILVDVATKSILVSRLKTYKPGELALWKRLNHTRRDVN
jgi:hypothetical protein